VSAPFRHRWRLTLPLAVPALGGLAYLYTFEAPARLIAVNAGALAAAVLWVRFGRAPSDTNPRLALAGLAALALLLPNMIGPVVGGVTRWFPAGPVALQSGPLLLPFIVVLVARAPRAAGAGVLALAALGLVGQPDAAGLAALGCASGVLAAERRGKAYAAVALGALVLAIGTIGRGTLEPQVFTEGVLAQVWPSVPLTALALGALLFLAAPALLLRGPHIPRAEALALAALLVTLGAIACLAPFPFPLIGYGASPILGFALALSAAGTAREA
jgi:hypothetical protein